jgi:predicted negative regulator of RcsB-dependent stress response
MTTHKQIEKQLKRPDSFQDTGLKIVNYLTQNKARIALMLSPILAVAVIGYGVMAWQKGQATKRRAELAKISAMVAEEQDGVAKQAEALQKEIDTLRTPTTPDPKNPEQKPATQSAESLLKIATLETKIKELKPDHSKSTAAFKEFYAANKSTAEGWMAGISWASTALGENKLTDAKVVVEEITKSSTAQKFFQIQSRYMLAGILEDLGEFDAALKEAEILSGLVDEDAKPMMLLLKAQILYFKKDLPAARPVLTEIVEKHGSTREAQTARSLLAEIGPAKCSLIFNIQDFAYLGLCFY